MLARAPLMTLLLAASSAWRLDAQCPDGTPPPCRAAAPRAARPVSAPAMSVAVLDFENVSRDTADAFLADGLAEELSERLGQLSRLSVASRSAVRRLPNSARMPMADLGRALNVAYLVTGSVRRSGERVRIGIELVRANNGLQSWSGTYDRGEGNLLSAQEEIARSVAGAIAGTLLPQERRAVAAAPTANAEAYQAWLLGLAEARRGVVGNDRPRAIAAFRQAVTLDSTFAKAWAKLAYYLSLVHRLGSGEDSFIVQARQAAQRAVQLAPGAADGHIAAGFVAYRAGYDYETALREFAVAERLSPNAEGLFAARATILKRAGRWDESIADRARSIAQDPLDPLELSEMVIALQFNRRFVEAERFIDRMEALNASEPQVPGFRFGGRLGRGRVDSALAPFRGLSLDSLVKMFSDWQQRALLPLLQPGMDTADLRSRALAIPHDRSRSTESTWIPVAYIVGWMDVAEGYGLRAVAAALAESLRVYQPGLPPPRTSSSLAFAATVMSRAGRTDEALRVIERARAVFSADAMAMSYLLHSEAEVRLRAGQTDAALALYERLMRQPSDLIPVMLRLDPLYVPLRGNPRFERLVAGP